jgi:hypothetical protein
MSYQVQLGHQTWTGLRCNLHIHTTHSDGHASHAELARLAAQAGLDAIVILDHNVYAADEDGWRQGVLVLVGVEVHDRQREPQSSHLLCLNLGGPRGGLYDGLTDLADDPQALVDAVAAAGGLSFLAHPHEHDAAPFLPEPNISWRDWQVTGYTGLELWNAMSEFKGALPHQAAALLFAFLPVLALRGPYPETLQKWGELLRERRMPVLGGSDAHATTYRMGPIRREVLSYEVLFRAVNTHLLLPEPVTGDLEVDAAALYAALERGHGFVVYERLGSGEGFRFWGRSGDREATMGEVLPLAGRTELFVDLPQTAEVRLLKADRLVARTHGRSLHVVVTQPGAYRVEAYRRFLGRRGWIFSNPIYVEDRTRPKA